jgi:predicted transcriptional regulator
MSNRPRRTPRKLQRLPAAASFARRIAALRALLPGDAAAAGDQGFKLLEEYLESQSERYGYRGEGSIRRYAQWLRGKDVLSTEELARIELYTEARNCLAHTYGLQTSPTLAEELLDFVALLLKGNAVSAEQLMTRSVRSVAADEPLLGVRNLVLNEGYSRLPVLDDAGRLLGLLTERDLMVAQFAAERAGRPLQSLTAGDALAPDALDRLVIAAPEASRDDVVELLRRTGVVACLVTPTGASDEQPIGIITHADLLYRM